MSFLAELKRRNVIRMAGLYLVGAWLIVQIAETLLPAFDVPGWVLRAVIILLAIGFVPAVVISWIFELTPDGLKREQDSATQPALAPRTAQRMNRLIVVGLIGVIVMMAVERIWLANPPTTALPTAIALVPDETTKAKAGEVAAQIVRGVAVLPFSNLSPDPNNAFFAGGVYEEVLTKLASVGELRVISRTSMERIAEQKLEVSTIGQRLGVSHVLEGSVRRAGDQVRVTVQLIEATSDAHVWAQNYDRNLDDVFAIQSEIAQSIAKNLQVAISPRQLASINERSTSNSEAYDLYLRALEEGRTWRGLKGDLEVIALLEPAVALDSGFLRARVQLMRAYNAAYWNDIGSDLRWDAKSRAQLSEISQRWPDHPQARLARAISDRVMEQDYLGALAQLEILATELPNDVEVLTELSLTLKWLDRREEFLSTARQVMALDPESQAALLELLIALEMNGLGEEAIAVAEQGLQRSPEDRYLRFSLVELKMRVCRDLPAVLEYGRTLSRADDFSRGPYLVADARFASGDAQGAIDLLAELRLRQAGLASVPSDVATADYLRLSGRSDEAEPIVRRAFDVVRAQVESGQIPPGVDSGIWFVRASSVAAMAGERALAEQWLDRSSEHASQSPVRRANYAEAVSDTQSRLGNVDAAWALIAPYAGDPHYLPNGDLLALKPLYDGAYGESMAYREYMAKLQAEVDQ